ncbi:hypothetical protein DPMN_106785 [Dreissena polymorpha]|uniref:Uncharacterized protein n=1 Tax=Dreissena polymorpha TaxID=45954 RepID=A0A9D4K5T8_DREPO|nr:hypothetical protein DPMN_106781 [Dreissena polymorpha]KAH3833475.1 hypothetical protein DPMN_106785 [Dreissena polymorpha]
MRIKAKNHHEDVNIRPGRVDGEAWVPPCNKDPKMNQKHSLKLRDGYSVRLTFPIRSKTYKTILTNTKAPMVQNHTTGWRGFKNSKYEVVDFGTFMSTLMYLVINGFVKSTASSRCELMLSGATDMVAFWN